MNVQSPEIQARRFFDGLVHLYLGREFDSPLQHLVTPLHSDASWYSDDHERHKVGEPVVPDADVELCEQCVAVSFQMALGLPVVPVAPEPRTLRRERARSRRRWFRSRKRPTVEAIRTAADEPTRPLMAVAV